MSQSEIRSTIEEQAANLLYLIIRNRLFSGSNKHIVRFAVLVLYICVVFGAIRHRLNRNGALKINDNALVTLALLVG